MIYSLDEIHKAAKYIFAQLGDYNIVLFEGQMGAGKTTLVKALCESMGVEDEMSSPTFSIVNEYAVGDELIYHFDFYRIKNNQEAMSIGTEEYFYSGDLCLIEWGGKVESLIPEDYLEISIKLVDRNQRELSITPHGGKA